MESVKAITVDVASQLETQSLSAVVGGFTFASAIAWMDVVRALVAMAVKSNKQTPGALAMTALLTTLLSVVMFMLISRISKRVEKPQQPVFAVTGR